MYAGLDNPYANIFAMVSPRGRSARFGIFVLGFVVGGLFGYWLFRFMEELEAVGGGGPLVYDAYVWLAALAVSLVIVFRRRR